ncbi:hypothetical protein [Tuwongella immobilis]|uniref:Uncharacterized protein n=1 Tax=Tuwongella immobilis TaxID=692036 RepID=A0A6C2YKF1_9BACT|nr:hypothetical protein [Tuwongella immobilis]VIP01906.1 unnamed protein product [Tuwongella immobilis]VTR99806.1 unnamed protein product [Tuwongella immobilis]
MNWASRTIITRSFLLVSGLSIAVLLRPTVAIRSDLQENLDYPNLLTRSSLVIIGTPLTTKLSDQKLDLRPHGIIGYMPRSETTVRVISTLKGDAPKEIVLNHYSDIITNDVILETPPKTIRFTNSNDEQKHGKSQEFLMYLVKTQGKYELTGAPYQQADSIKRLTPIPD